MKLILTDSTDLNRSLLLTKESFEGDKTGHSLTYGDRTDSILYMEIGRLSWCLPTENSVGCSFFSGKVLLRAELFRGAWVA